MLVAHGRHAAAVVVAALAVTTTAFTFFALTQPTTSAQAAASLTVFIGSAEIQKSNAATFTPAQSNDQVSAGDTIRTGAATKAAITYPSGSVARLDSNTQLTISQLGRTDDGGWSIDAFQATGKTWSRLTHLVSGSSYFIHAPNSVAAEVRGTEFEVIVDAQASPSVVRLNVFNGVVGASANQGNVVVDAGQSTTAPAGSKPSPPAAITIADRRDTFTVFNQTADAAPGQPVGVNTNNFNTSDTTGVVAGPPGDGGSDLRFTLGWPGSRFELTVFDPTGAVYAQTSSVVSPVAIDVPQASGGVWSYQVTDVESQPAEAWWVIITRVAHPSAVAPSAAPPSAGSGAPAPAASGPPVAGASSGGSNPVPSPPAGPVTLPPGTPPVTPPVTLPPVTTPPVTLPPSTLPPITLLPITLPPISLPPISLPPISLPPITVPLPVGLPPVTLPPVTLPLPSVPPVTLPPVVLPTPSVPPISLPPVTLPPVTLPKLL